MKPPDGLRPQGKKKKGKGRCKVQTTRVKKNASFWKEKGGQRLNPHRIL